MKHEPTERGWRRLVLNDLNFPIRNALLFIIAAACMNTCTAVEDIRAFLMGP